MRRILTVAVLATVLATPAATAATGDESRYLMPVTRKAETPKPRKERCPGTLLKIEQLKQKTWKAQAALDRRMTAASSQPIVSCKYARWVAKRWQAEHRAVQKQMRALRQEGAKMDRHLAGTPMAGLGSLLVQEGRRGNLRPEFIVAVAAKESSIGHAACGSNPRNVWGLGACGRAWSPPYFGTWREAIRYFVTFINGRWSGATTPWHFGGYCAGCESSWASGVSSWMGRFGGGASIRYG